MPILKRLIVPGLGVVILLSASISSQRTLSCQNREIPNLLTLRGPVLEVICQNEAVGYKRARCRVATENGLAEDLAAKCQSLINDEGSLGNLVLAVDTFDTFLARRTWWR